MKSKDQTLLEEAYGQIVNNKSAIDKITKSMSALDASMRQSPSVKSLYTQWSDTLDLWNVYEAEKTQEVINALLSLQKSLETQYNPTDADKYSSGVGAPTSQIKRTIDTFQALGKINASASSATQQSPNNKQQLPQTRQFAKQTPAAVSKPAPASGTSFDQKRFALELSRLSNDLLNKRMPQQRNIETALNMLKSLDAKVQGSTKERIRGLLGWLTKSMGSSAGPTGAGAAQFTATKLSQELQFLSKLLTQQK